MITGTGYVWRGHLTRCDWAHTRNQYTIVTSEHSVVLFLVEIVFCWVSLGAEIVYLSIVSLCSLQCGDCREWMSDLVTTLLRLHILSDRVWRLFCCDPIERGKWVNSSLSIFRDSNLCTWWYNTISWRVSVESCLVRCKIIWCRRIDVTTSEKYHSSDQWYHKKRYYCLVVSTVEMMNPTLQQHGRNALIEYQFKQTVVYRLQTEDEWANRLTGKTTPFQW